MINTAGEYEHIVIAVHGIGDQMRKATVRDVATRIASIRDLAAAEMFDAAQPLGYFRGDVAAALRSSPPKNVIDLCPLTQIASIDVTDASNVSPLRQVIEKDDRLKRIGFSEVYWADIPDIAVRDAHSLDETKRWARTVVSRARAEYYKTRHLLDDKALTRLSNIERLQLREPDFSLATEVLEEVVDTINVLENLLFLAKKAGVLQFDLHQLLEQYVGDVQVVAEFSQFRYNILGRFHQAMQQIYKENKNSKLHIVAHSEGTVVAFLALLHAIAGRQFTPATATAGGKINQCDKVPDWLPQVAGLLTIGSPIDKHILLWPELFDGFDFSNPLAQQSAKIEWRNYYDYGDPVGFELDTARQWLDEVHCTAFDFRQDTESKSVAQRDRAKKMHDIGFARYILPGKAHNDYWDDTAVFEHYVRDVMYPNGPPATIPPTRRIVYVLSPLIPYFLSFMILYAGTLLLHRAVGQFSRPPLDTLQSYMLWSSPDSSCPVTQVERNLYLEALGLSMLFAGTTLLARSTRLAKGVVGWGMGMLAFAVGCLAYRSPLVPVPARDTIGLLFKQLGGNATTCTIVSAFVVATLGWLGMSKFGQAQRKERWIRKGMRPLIVCGTTMIAALVIFQMLNRPCELRPKERDAMAERYVHRRTNELSRMHPELTLDAQSVAGLRKEGGDRAEQFSVLIRMRPPVWPVLLSGAAFLYLWWLAALIFDLGFVWQRYVRHSMALKRLGQWRRIRAKVEAAVGSASPSEDRNLASG